MINMAEIRKCMATLDVSSHTEIQKHLWNDLWIYGRVKSLSYVKYTSSWINITKNLDYLATLLEVSDI